MNDALSNFLKPACKVVIGQTKEMILQSYIYYTSFKINVGKNFVWLYDNLKLICIFQIPMKSSARNLVGNSTGTIFISWLIPEEEMSLENNENKETPIIFLQIF